MRFSALLLAALCAAAVAAAPAGAATTVTTSGSQLVVAAAPGLANHVTVSPGATPATVRVADTADVVTTADPACVLGPGNALDCPAPASAQVDLGDGDDTLAAAATPVPLAVDAGDGNDVVRVDDGMADAVVCGAGADDASAADPQDTLTGCEETPATAGAPETTIPAHPASPTRLTAAGFTFGASEPASFTCSLDDAPYAPCQTTEAFPDLPDGAHTLRVRATDAIGNADATPASYTWTVDTVAPTAAFAAAPAALTNDARPAFSIAVSDPAATLACSVDGAVFTACAATPVLPALADGAHTLQVRATDAAGNSAVIAHTWTQDSVRPQTVLTAGPATSTPVASATATLAFTSTTATRFECSLDGGAWQTCTSPTYYNGLADGAHSFAVRAVDAAGNADGTPATRAWTVRADGAPTARIAITRDGDGFALSGAGSTDPDGGGLTYRWLQNDRAAGATATIHYTAPDAESRDVLTLTVVDAGGRRGQATVALRTRATTERGAQETTDVIPFAAGTRLASGARARIAALKRALAGGGATVRIEGFARPAGAAARTARARARAVGRLLLAGAPRSTRSTVTGHGAGGAVASNATPAGRARNDRVVVSVTATGANPRLVTEAEGGPAVSHTNAPQPATTAAARRLRLFAFWSNVPGGLTRLEEVGARVDVLAPNWYALSPADASIRGGRPNPRITTLSRRLGFAVWPVVNATMKGAPLLDTPAGRTRIVAQVTALAARYRLAGVTLDMEEMLPRQRAAYSALVAQLAAALHGAHRKLAVYAVRRTATDIDDGAAAYDWAALARSADLVLASGYNEHSAATTPGPVTTAAGFAAVARYAAATARTKIAPTMGAFGYQWAGGGARMVSSADAERRWPVAAEPGSADGRRATAASAPTWYESAEDLWARERAAAQAGARWIGLFTLGREPARYWERSAAR